MKAARIVLDANAASKVRDTVALLSFVRLFERITNVHVQTVALLAHIGENTFFLHVWFGEHLIDSGHRFPKTVSTEHCPVLQCIPTCAVLAAGSLGACFCLVHKTSSRATQSGCPFYFGVADLTQ